MDKGNIWVVDDDESIRWVLERGLSENGIEVETFDSANKVIKKLETESPSLILTDIKMPGKSGIDLLDEVKELRPEIPIIIMTAHSDLESAVESYEHGAWEYLPKPFDIEEAVSMVQRATTKDNTEIEALARSVVGEFEQYIKLNKKISPEVLSSINQIDDYSKPAFIFIKKVISFRKRFAAKKTSMGR